MKLFTTIPYRSIIKILAVFSGHLVTTYVDSVGLDWRSFDSRVHNRVRPCVYSSS